MLDKKGDNSFELMWKKYDATTLWEVLPVSTKFMKEKPGIMNNRSHSHPMQAGFDSWFFDGIAGIQPDITAPGFKKVILEPKLTNQLKWARADYNSVYGKIVSDRKWQGKKLIWNIEIPVNTTAEIRLPEYFSELQIDGKTVIKTKKKWESYTYPLSSGKHIVNVN